MPPTFLSFEDDSSFLKATYSSYNCWRILRTFSTFSLAISSSLYNKGKKMPITRNLHLGSKTLAMDTNKLHCSQYLSNYSFIGATISLIKKSSSSDELSITCLTLQTSARYKLVVRYSLPNIICVVKLNTSKSLQTFSTFF